MRGLKGALAALALLTVVPSSAVASHLGEARTLPAIALPVPAAGTIIVGAIKIHVGGADAVAASRRPYAPHLVNAKAYPGAIAIVAYNTERTSKAVTRTFLFIVARRAQRTLSARNDEDCGGKNALNLITIGAMCWSADLTRRDKNNVNNYYYGQQDMRGREVVATATITDAGATPAKVESALEKLLKDPDAWKPSAFDVAEPDRLSSDWYDDGHAWGWRLHDSKPVADWRKLALPDASLDDVIADIQRFLANDGPPAGSEGCTITGTGVINGTPGNDVICGGSGDDTCNAGAGNDICKLGDGNNVCNLGPGNDRCETGGGDDTCNGGPGKDVCELGAGTNVCIAETCHGTTGQANDPNQYTCTGPSQKIYDNWNVYSEDPGAQGGPTFSTNGKAYCLDWIATYHYNKGKGAPPGTLSLVGGGQTLGPFKAEGQDGQGGVHNANWVATIPATQKVVLSGSYTCKDSDPSTWAQNAESGHLGFCRVWGREATKTG